MRERTVALSVANARLSNEIEDSRLVQDALHESEERFQLIAETSPVAIFISTIEDGTILFCNAAAGDLQHVPHEELIGRRVTELYKDPADRLPLVKELEEKGKFRDRPREIVTRDGESRWVTLSARRIAFEGKPALLSAVVDTTDQRRAGQELRVSERRYRDVVEGERTLTIRFKPDTTLTFVNTAYAIQRQTPPRELIGKKFIDFMPDDEKNEVLAYLASFTIDQPVKSREFRALQPDGSIHWRAWTHRAFFGDDGEVAEFQAVGHDTTERKRAEEALRASEERFRDVAEASSDWFWETDGEFRYTYFSDRVKSVSGKYPHHLIGKTRWESASVDRDEDKWRAHRKDLEAHRFFRDFRYDYETTDGRLIHIQASGKPVFDAAGVFKGYRGSASNITERVEAEKVLRRQALIVNQITDGLIISDLEGLITDWNRGAERMFGYAREEVLGKSPALLHPAEGEGGQQTAIDKALARDGQWAGEGRFTRKDGSEGISETVIVPFRDEKGNVVASIGVNRDITDRKRAEEALRESEERFKTVFDHSPATITLKDLDWRYLLANVEFLNRFDLEEKDVLGRTAHEFLSGSYADQHAELDRRALDEKVTIEREVHSEYPDGSARDILVVKFPVLGADEEPVAIGTITTDITERKRAEAELRESEERFRGLFEGSIQGIFISKGLEPIFANQSFADIFGYDSPRDIVDMVSEHSFVAPCDQARLDGYAEARMRGEEAPSAYEFQGMRKDGSQIWLENQVSAVAWHGEPVRRACAWSPMPCPPSSPIPT